MTPEERKEYSKPPRQPTRTSPISESMREYVGERMAACGLSDETIKKIGWYTTR